MKDEDLKLEEIQASHTLGGAVITHLDSFHFFYLDCCLL